MLELGLDQALQAYDGRKISILSEVRARFDGKNKFLPELIALIGSQNSFVSDGATWLIKNCAEDGVEMKLSVVETIIARLDAVTTWQSALHLCQTVKHLHFTPDQARRFAEWATPLLEHQRPFLRAWSMDALQHIAVLATDIAPLAHKALDRATRDQAASVRARARKHTTNEE